MEIAHIKKETASDAVDELIAAFERIVKGQWDNFLGMSESKKLR